MKLRAKMMAWILAVAGTIFIFGIGSLILYSRGLLLHSAEERALEKLRSGIEETTSAVSASAQSAPTRA